jgi:arginine repressor
MNLENHYEEEELIKSYFNQGFTNAEILEYLRVHGVDISLSTLKRRLASMHLCRRLQHGVENRGAIRDAIETELAGSGCFVGY